MVAGAARRARVDALPEGARITVAVDPPVTGHSGSDACGIVVVGVVQAGRRATGTRW